MKYPRATTVRMHGKVLEYLKAMPNGSQFQRRAVYKALEDAGYDVPDPDEIEVGKGNSKRERNQIPV